MAENFPDVSGALCGLLVSTGEHSGLAAITRACAADAGVHLPSSTGTRPSTAQRCSVEAETPAIRLASARLTVSVRSSLSSGLMPGLPPDAATGP